LRRAADYLAARREIVAAAPSQDQQYTAAAERFAPAIERLARGYEADAELRRDLVQEIHVQLWRSFAYFEGQCSKRSWVYRVAHNVAVTHLIKRRRLKAETSAALEDLETVAAEGDPERAAGEKHAVERLLATVHRLKPADRQVMLLYLEELSAAEIADVTGLSPGAVAVRIHRAKDLLAGKFNQEKTP
jgi:RNA polymerase sigma-70 factor (ECF subfamily)